MTEDAAPTEHLPRLGRALEQHLAVDATKFRAECAMANRVACPIVFRKLSSTSARAGRRPNVFRRSGLELIFELFKPISQPL